MIRIGQPETWNFTYNADGLRTQKTNGTRTYQYTYLGDQLSQMTVDGHTLYFTYDTNGSPISLTYDGTCYYYVTNLQGDILALLDTTGTEVVRYAYDAWGNLLTVTGSHADTIGHYNPLRYRAYVYDEETGLYYLQSRYYNPEIGRFISADGYASTGQGLLGNNMFAYCGNNPVNRNDSTGEAWEHWALGALIVVGCGIATVVTCGGFAAAATAVCLVGSGVATTTVASTIAASAFVGTATAYGVAVLSAASASNSVQDFRDQGNWNTVTSTALCGLSSAYGGYTLYKAQDTFLPDSFYSKHAPKQSTPYSSYTNYTYNDYTRKYEKSTAYYDFAGRQSIRIDWTNHGYSNHGNPHVHYTTYSSRYRDGTTVRWD